MNNNVILKKLRIAFNMKDTDIVETLKLVDFQISRSEVNALFRNSEHRNFKTCGDQLLRNFLDGIIALEKKSKKKI